jgi:hypothetical protein
MHPSRYAPKPETGELTKDQPVIVYRSANDMRGRKPEDRAIPARIVKANRVWIELTRSDLPESAIGHQTWRMRRDSMDEGTQYSGSNARFVTIEQHEWHETRAWALGFLRENGIRIERGTWYDREVELADIISNGTDRTEAL